MATLSKRLKLKLLPGEEAPDSTLSSALNPVEDEDEEEELAVEDTEEETFVPETVPRNIFTGVPMTHIDEGEEEDDSAEAGAGGVEALDKNERDRAYSLFEKAKSRNEWMELAQLLGKAATQYAAAQSGMQTGRAVGPLQIPEIDYGKKTEGEERLLERRLRDIRATEAGLAKAAIAKEVKEQKEKAAQKAEDWKTKQDIREEEKLKLAKAKAARETAVPKLTEEEKIRMREDARIRAAERIANEKKDKAIDALITTQGTIISPDSSPQQKEQAKKALLYAAQKAGINMSEVYEQAQMPGLISRTTGGAIGGTTLDESKIIPILQSMKSTASAKTTPPPSPPPGQTPAGQTPPPSGTMTQQAAPKTITVRLPGGATKQLPEGKAVKMRGKDGSIAEVSPDKVQKYLDKGGEIVQ